MITEIQSLLAQVPFEPFSISMNDGKIYSVPSRDHIFLLLSKVIVKNDAGDFWWLAARNMTSLSGKSSASSTFDEPKPTQG